MSLVAPRVISHALEESIASGCESKVVSHLRSPRPYPCGFTRISKQKRLLLALPKVYHRSACSCAAMPVPVQCHLKLFSHVLFGG